MAMRFANPTLIPDYPVRPGDQPPCAYVPPAVRPGRIPTWMRRRIREITPKAQHRPYRGWEVDVLHGPGTDWIDHCGTATWQGREVFVCEPYPLGLNSLRDIVAFCDRYALSVRVGAASSHYPTACLRLEFSPQGDPPGGGTVVPLDHPA